MQAGYYITEGTYNTAIGYQAMFSNAVGISNSTAVGVGAYANASNQIVLGRTSEHVVIGGYAPSSGASGSLYVANGLNIGTNFTSFVVTNAGAVTCNNMTVTGTLYFQSTGNYIKNDAQMYIVTDDFMYITAPTQLTITSATTNCTGTLNATTFNATSDYRIKENVVPLDLTKYSIDRLNPVSYINKKTEKQDIGLIAHELQEEFPFLVNGEKDAETMQSVNYVSLISLLIKEVQDLKKRVKELEEK